MWHRAVRSFAPSLRQLPAVTLPITKGMSLSCPSTPNRLKPIGLQFDHDMPPGEKSEQHAGPIPPANLRIKDRLISFQSALADANSLPGSETAGIYHPTGVELRNAAPNRLDKRIWNVGGLPAKADQADRMGHALEGRQSHLANIHVNKHVARKKGDDVTRSGIDRFHPKPRIENLEAQGACLMPNRLFLVRLASQHIPLTGHLDTHLSSRSLACGPVRFPPGPICDLCPLSVWQAYPGGASIVGTDPQFRTKQFPLCLPSRHMLEDGRGSNAPVCQTRVATIPSAGSRGSLPRRSAVTQLILDAEKAREETTPL